MAPKRKLTPEEFNALIPRILAAADAPIAVLEFEPSELDFDLDEPLANVFSPELPAAPAAKVPETPVSMYKSHPILIRIPERVIRAFKNEAKRTGGCYQTLMNKFLKVAAEGFV